MEGDDYVQAEAISDRKDGAPERSDVDCSYDKEPSC
jgi:hypothetical protein